jgi:hypothetical protein
LRLTDLARSAVSAQNRPRITARSGIPNSKDPSMIIATSLALLPVRFVAVMAARESRPSWRQLQQIRALPEPGIDRIGKFPNDLAGATEAYAAHLNAPRGILGRTSRSCSTRIWQGRELRWNARGSKRRLRRRSRRRGLLVSRRELSSVSWRL